MQAAWPALHGYWANGPLEMEQEGAAGEEGPEAEPSIGVATDAGEGRLALELRAENVEGGEGIIGHAWLILEPGDPGYDQIAAAVAQEAPGRGERGVLIPPLNN
jgi:hypothetical protein